MDSWRLEVNMAGIEIIVRMRHQILELRSELASLRQMEDREKKR
jgi:hypothetical protein